MKVSENADRDENNLPDIDNYVSYIEFVGKAGISQDVSRENRDGFKDSKGRYIKYNEQTDKNSSLDESIFGNIDSKVF